MRTVSVLLVVPAVMRLRHWLLVMLSELLREHRPPRRRVFTSQPSSKVIGAVYAAWVLPRGQAWILACCQAWILLSSSLQHLA